MGQRYRASNEHRYSTASRYKICLALTLKSIYYTKPLSTCATTCLHAFTCVLLRVDTFLHVFTCATRVYTCYMCASTCLHVFIRVLTLREYFENLRTHSRSIESHRTESTFECWCLLYHVHPSRDACRWKHLMPPCVSHSCWYDACIGKQYVNSTYTNTCNTLFHKMHVGTCCIPHTCP